MIKKLITISILLSILIIPTSAVYTITTNITDYSVTYNFVPDIDKQAEVYFDNELITFWIEDELTMCGLESDTCYRLSIQELPDTVQYLHIHTLETEQPPFYAEYGIIGLFILIIALIILSAKIEFTGYIAILLSTIGFMYVMKNEPDYYTSIIFGVMIIMSVLTTSLTTNRE